jgi:uncharacterized membrane protein YecN with MAPEG domain
MSWRSPNSQVELDRDMNRIGNWTLCISLFSLGLVQISVEFGWVIRIIGLVLLVGILHTCMSLHYANLAASCIA